MSFRLFAITIPLGILFLLSVVGGTLTDPLTLQYAVLLGVIVLAVGVGIAAGINILGSGLDSESVFIAFMITMLISAFGAIGILGIGVILQIPYGAWLFAILSIIYIIGVIGMFTRGGD